MSDTRRGFIKKATMLAGGMGIGYTVPASIRKAFAIDPVKGTTYLDAEHVVILMQENRSFDHCYGALQGVRGFNDPRAIDLPDGDKVWLQKNAAGETYIPFRLNIKETKSTWIGSLPHSWTNQVDARNNGKYDQWLIAKPSGNKAYANVPLTMGYYNRQDIPFYYALADAFTVCDQNFSSSLTGTTPNRLYLWTGTVRENNDPEKQANVRNEDVDFNKEVNWKTFPERLSEAGVSWKIYQNEISLATGLNGEEESWLCNFTDNPLEWFSQYNVRFSKTRRAFVSKSLKELPDQIIALQERIAQGFSDSSALEKAKRELAGKQERLSVAEKEHRKYTQDNFEKLSEKDKQLHANAFVTNTNDPYYRELETLQYRDEGQTREVKIPKGDVLHQFRHDVSAGSLPAVSWLVAPENFSDHPGAPWYGAWYVSEVLDILTQNPEVWKKTIFILCYDENDGYFDHVPPFVPHNPTMENSGKASAGIDVTVEHVTLEQDRKGHNAEEARASSIGLGYRVPLVVASPWSRGGAVCSQVFDHTSIVQLLENIFTRKSGKEIKETNISVWRRTVCGDLSAVFTPYNGETIKLPSFLKQEGVIESIHKAKFRKDPFGYKALNEQERRDINQGSSSSILPVQENGTRTSCPLPYELYVNGRLTGDAKRFRMEFAAGNKVFGTAAAGAPFTVYATETYRRKEHMPETGLTWNYTVAAGDSLMDEWLPEKFDNAHYHFKVHGPNGFYREFAGDNKDAGIAISVKYEETSGSSKLTGNLVLVLERTINKTVTVLVRDNSYGDGLRKIVLDTSVKEMVINLARSFSWYDISVTVQGNQSFLQRFAGHVETGELSRTDPAMGSKVKSQK